ncbi:hypothetical protein ACICHK_40600 [Streptomyces sp. AHU1]|uniref:hypothetical protein n=1 Tax=Streptomyces sp. AHU1 TaxID=3377215 RepID=UPI003877CD87
MNHTAVPGPLAGDRRAVRTPPGSALPDRLVDGMAVELAFVRDLLTEHGLKELP